MNIFHFSRSAGDFSVYDISACYEDHSKLHLMVIIYKERGIHIIYVDTNGPQIRMGWTPEMDIEGTRNLFEGSVREVNNEYVIFICQGGEHVQISLGGE